MSRAVQTLVLGLLYFYKYIVSPAFPSSCRYYPTCSAYALTAVKRYGPFRGSVLAVKRLLRCHPFHSGGYDPVP